MFVLGEKVSLFSLLIYRANDGKPVFRYHEYADE